MFRDEGSFPYIIRILFLVQQGLSVLVIDQPVGKAFRESQPCVCCAVIFLEALSVLPSFVIYFCSEFFFRRPFQLTGL